MNKSISISLGGLSFFIEEDAYYELQKYLEDVKSSLDTEEEDKAEILKDVEARIAELFKEWLGNYRQVLDAKDVDKMIGIMGTPEQYQSESVEEENNSSYKKTNSSEQSNKDGKFYQRQLYRDTEDKMIAGICGGLAHFFGFQPIWLRLGLVVIILFSGWLFDGLVPIIFLAYIILWIVVPKAVTTSDKLKMKGKPVNFDSIKEYINKEEISEQVGEINKKISKASSGVGKFFESLFQVLIKVLALFTGFIFVIIAVAFIISYFVCSFSLSLPGINYSEYIDLIFDSSWQLYALVVLLGLVLLIPSLFLLLLGLRLITGKKVIKTTTTAVITLFIVWLVSTMCITILSMNLIASQFGETVEKTNKFVLNTVTSDTLNINVKDYQGTTIKTYYKMKGLTYGINMDEIIRFTRDSVLVKIENKLEIKQSPDSNFYLEVKTSSSGKNETTAQKNLSKISYKYNIEGNNLNLDSYMSMKKIAKFRNQEVELILYIPKEKYINVQNIKKIYNEENGNTDIFYNYKINSSKIFKFAGNSLKCLSCDTLIQKDSSDIIRIDKQGIKIRSKKDSIEINLGKENIKIKKHGTNSF